MNTRAVVIFDLDVLFRRIQISQKTFAILLDAFGITQARAKQLPPEEARAGGVDAGEEIQKLVVHFADEIAAEIEIAARLKGFDRLFLGAHGGDVMPKLLRIDRGRHVEKNRVRRNEAQRLPINCRCCYCHRR